MCPSTIIRTSLMILGSELLFPPLSISSTMGLKSFSPVTWSVLVSPKLKFLALWAFDLVLGCFVPSLGHCFTLHCSYVSWLFLFGFG